MPTRTDSAIAKTKAAAHAVKAKLDGLHGVFATLAKQHAEVSALMKRVEDDADKREELWPKIRMDLLSHERGELRVVYPELRMNAATRSLADEHEEEAKELEGLIHELDGTAIDSNMWGSRFATLAETVRQHAELEEKEIFPQAQQVIGKMRTKAMNDEFLAAKKQVSETV
jgi:hemerythrin superfamily protein